jgi:putative endonuclease
MLGLWRKLLGDRGERAASTLLKRQGHRILARNYRCPAGEIDLITLDGNTLVFVEVKTRSSDAFADPEQAVGHRKQQRIIRAAECYRQFKGAQAYPCRFDVVSIVMQPNGRPNAHHIRDAFTITD